MTPASTAPPEHPRRRRRAVVGLALVAVLAIVGAALWHGAGGDAEPPAAVVGGAEIPASVVTADLAAESAVPAKDKSLPADNPLRDPDPTVTGTYTAAARAEALGNRILYTLYGQHLTARRLSPTAADRAAVRTTLCTDPTTGAAPTGSSCPGLAGYDPTYRAYLLETQARVTALGRVIYGRAYVAVRDTRPTVLQRACFSSVLVADSTVADAVRGALDQGATMDQAAAVGAKQGSVGDVTPSCNFLVDLPTQLADPRPGGAASLSIGGRLYVVQVTSVAPGSKADFLDEPPLQDDDVNAIVQRESTRVLGGTPITVDPAYGRWDASGLVVSAPGTTTKPATTSTTVP